MKIIGEKIKIARILQGYTITDLANKMNVTKQSISLYENGTEPRDEICFKLLNCLNCSMDFLIRPLKCQVTPKNTFFRATATATAIDRKNQEIKASLVISLYNYLSELLELPSLNIPTMLDNIKDIESKAKCLREYWGYGDRPIKNMINCLEKNGFIVSSFSSGYEIDGYTQQYYDEQIGADRYCIIVENNKESWVRKNFSLAHELGHAILHKDINYMELQRVEQNQLETEANRFAAAFLLPKESFTNDAKNAKYLDDFLRLKLKWNVSIGALMLRARDLKIISDEQYLRLIKNYSYRRYKKNEPFDDEIVGYQPSIFKQGLTLLFENGFTFDRFEEDLKDKGLSLPLHLIETLCDLGDGFFDRYKAPNIIRIKKI